MKMVLLTTTKFHILAASATVVQTVLQPANNINFWGLLYKRSYITLAPRPGSHCKEYEENEKNVNQLIYVLDMHILIVWNIKKIANLLTGKEKMPKRIEMLII